MSTIAVPVMDESLKIARNAGHTPFFAIFEVGGGVFKTISLKEIRENPKMKGHACNESDHVGRHVCDHDKNDLEHIKAHDTMAEAIKDCDFLMVKMACKNTANSMASFGIKLKKYNGNQTHADKALGEISATI